MAKTKPKSRACAFPKCVRATSELHCQEHRHTAVLQAEIDRLRSTATGDDGGWWHLLDAYPSLRRVGEVLTELEYRADPQKASAVQVVQRSRGHGFGDGIVVLGDHKALPGYAVAAARDSGRLGAAVAKVNELARQLENHVNPAAGSEKDLRRRCGRSKCPGKNRRQAPEQTHCGFCGIGFGGHRPTPPTESTDSPHKPHESVEEPEAGSGPPQTVHGGTEAPPPRPTRPPADANGSNGHHHLNQATRRVVVTAPTMHAAGVIALAEARDIWPGISNVVSIEATPGGDWKVAVAVDEELVGADAERPPSR